MARSAKVGDPAKYREKNMQDMCGLRDRAYNMWIMNKIKRYKCYRDIDKDRDCL